jgi:hypothetical protein
MSLLIPRETIDVLRNNVNVILDSIGIDCTVYVPTSSSLDDNESLDIFEKPSDLTYLSYSAMCFIVWNPSKYRMRKLGIYTEDEIPMIIWLPNKATALEGLEAGTKVDVDIVQRSYIRVNPEFIPNDTTDVTEYELVDLRVKGMHDAVLIRAFKGVPRRIERISDV